MDIGKIRTMIEKNPALNPIADVLRRMGFVHVLHTFQADREKKKLNGAQNDFSRFVSEHEAEFQKVYEILDDSFSKKTYQAVVEYRKTFDIRLLNPVVVQPQYFLKDILPPEETEIFVDGGAYIGDSSRRFLRKYKGGGKYKIFLWEPDQSNREQIHKTLRKSRHYEVIPYAMWSETAQLRFSNAGSGTSRVEEEGILVNADSIDNQMKGKKVTFIKMDIEGAEIEALKGAEKIIKKQKPKLAICIYHEYSHLYQIPLMIKEMVPEYKIYIRQHSDTASETVVYAVISDGSQSNGGIFNT